uniref:Secreted protein n=1 Tax=Trichuris muris TaxID=70415 RepID=A0A5S6QVJ9_TRIMR
MHSCASLLTSTLLCVVMTPVLTDTEENVAPGALLPEGRYAVRDDVDVDRFERSDLRVRYPFDLSVVGDRTSETGDSHYDSGNHRESTFGRRIRSWTDSCT